MNIVHLIDYFQPRIGYQETFLAREHMRSGHAVTVVTSDRFCRFPSYSGTFATVLGSRRRPWGEREEEGIHTIRVPSLEIPSSPLVYLFGLKRVLCRLRPDVVFCHGVYSFSSYFCARYKTACGYALLFDSHAAAFNTNLENGLFKRLYFRFFLRFFAPVIRSQADAIFAVGDEEKRFLIETVGFPPRDIPVIRLGVAPDVFRFSQSDRRKVRKALGISPSAFVLVSSGKFSHEKDIHVLVSAMRRIRDSNILCLLVGNGDAEYLSCLRGIPSSQLIRTGYIANSLLPAYFSAADFAVYPGNFTLSILEAMSCRLGIILPDQPSTRFLRASRGIAWFRRGDGDDLSLKIRYVVSHPLYRLRLGANARSYVSSHLSWRHIAAQTLSLVSREGERGDRLCC